MTEVVKIDKHDGIGILTLNRPGALNALTQELARYIADSLMPDFSKCIAINSKLAKCPEMNITCFLEFLISSNIS